MDTDTVYAFNISFGPEIMIFRVKQNLFIMKKRDPFLWRTVQRLSLCCIFFISALGLSAQNSVVVQSLVMDSNNEPLIGVSVLEKNTKNGTITDFDGKFSLKVDLGATIVLSYIGYQTIEVKAGEVKGAIVMREDTKVLDEVVVVGYGIQKRVNLSGAVAAIDGDKIAAKPSSSALAALQGEMPGVAVLRSSGQPGSETSGMRIRGFSSINQPNVLVLIDGMEGDLNLINANDIESISVLKDAAAASIYGARAAAGVMLVTTKTGKAGKPKISYNGYFAVNTPGNMPERLPAWEEQVFINESRINQGANAEWNDEQSSWVANPNFNYRKNPNGRWDLFQATNWVEDGTRDQTTQQNHAVSVSGGTKEVNYLISANYYTKNGLLKYGPDSNERYNMRAKINGELNKYLSFALNMSYEGNYIETNPFSAVNILERLYRVRGRQPIFQPEEDTNDSPYNGDLQVNPIDIMQNGGIDKNQYEAFTGKGTLTIKDLVKGLRVNLSAARKAGFYSQMITKRTLIWNGWNGGMRFQTNNPNELTKKKNSDYKDLFEATADYGFSLGKHNVSLLGGITYENYRKDEIAGTVKNLISNDFYSFKYYDSSIPSNTSVTDKIEPWSMLSYFGRVNYNFADRYLLEANIRYDGSSRLAPEYRWKAFPSISAAWRVSEEQWFNIPEVTNLKLRASTGSLGNGAMVGFYDYLALITSGTQMGESFYFQKTLASKDKSWEIVRTTNVGLDLGLFNNRLNVTADYYWKKNSDMYIDVNRPSQIGIEVPKANIAELKVWGWDLEVNWKDRIQEVAYQIGFNISDSRNEVTKLNGKNLVAAGTVDYLEGYPINSIWGYKTDGYWKSRQEYLDYKAANPGYQSFQDGIVSGGDVKYVAQGNPDHTIGAGDGTTDNPGDLVYFGDATGRYLYGITLGAQWRGFDFSVMFQGVAKRTVMVDTKTVTPLAETSTMPWTIHRDYAKIDENGELINPDAAWPRLYNYNNGDLFNYNASDRWVQDGSYIRLKNLTFGYTVPVSKNVLDKLRIYVTGADIWEHTNMLSIFDPEVENKAKANYYPFFRTWTVGLNVTF